MTSSSGIKSGDSGPVRGGELTILVDGASEDEDDVKGGMLREKLGYLCESGADMMLQAEVRGDE